MARFAIDTAHDKSAEVWIASFLSLIYSILTLGARVYLKGWLAGTFGPDDASILIAQVLALGQFVTTMYGVHEGLAKDLSLLDKSRKDHIAKVRSRSGNTAEGCALTIPGFRGQPSTLCSRISVVKGVSGISDRTHLLAT